MPPDVFVSAALKCGYIWLAGRAHLPLLRLRPQHRGPPLCHQLRRDQNQPERAFLRGTQLSDTEADPCSITEFWAVACPLCVSQALDNALDIARQLGLRLIIPFVDQWRWVGGITSYARFRGFEDLKEAEEQFWQNPQV